MSSKLNKSSELNEHSHHKSKKFINVRVHFLDDSTHDFQLQSKSLGQVLFEKVCSHIKLLEVDYFGLECEDEKGSKCWLDLLKPLCSQLQSSHPSMHFSVKFYTPDPAQLEDEFTRYLFSLQIKKDLMNGSLQCNDSTAAVMISYIVQAEFGDFNAENCNDFQYLKPYKLIAFQDEELEKKIMENHKKIVGQTPAEADLNLLETARRCELYGVKMTSSKDHEGVSLNLAVIHLGVVVFQNFTKINTFSWAKIRKLSFKRKKFLIKLHPEGYGFYKDTVEFIFDSRNDCKNFWKKCIENHTFFRCSDAKQGMRMKPKIFSRGSSFRYSGRTQKQVSDFVRQHNFKRPQFQRSTSLKTPTSPTKSISSSIIPQPLLPLTSSSCGSISEVSKDTMLPPKSTSEPTTPHTAPDFIKAVNGNNSINVSVEKHIRDEVDSNINHINDPDSFEPDNNNTSCSETDTLDSKGNFTNGCAACPSDLLKLSNQTLQSDKQECSSLNLSDSFNDNLLSQELKYKNGGYYKDPSTDENSEQILGSSTFYISSPYSVRLSSKKRVLNDRTYCSAKELLMTERTYRKDLEIINVTFRDAYSRQRNRKSEAIEQFLTVVNPLYEMHCSLLRDLEQRLASWEGRPANKNQHVIKGVADILHKQKDLIKVHSTYLKKLPTLLEMLYEDLNQNECLAQLYEQFEAEKVCYLPLTSFFLRPTCRIIYYHSLLENLLYTYNKDHEDYNYCISLYEEMKTYCDNFINIMLPLVNYSKLIELQPSLANISSLVDKSRKFIREGSVVKFTKSGSQQCMLFLFNDILLYTLRIHDSMLRFKVLGQIPCEDLTLQEIEPKLGFSHCYALCSPDKHLYLASPSAEEHSKWMRDLQKAGCGRNSVSKPALFSMDENLNEDDVMRADKPVGQHINTSIHICWHRNISISCTDLYISMKNSLSGYLLRKFKNSNGWQKVWVVLANLCLFFYRSYLDDSPLAGLPLAGYKIMNTTSSDLVSGECIFKLIFKNHEYFFMVENKYLYERWVDAIHSCTLSEEEDTHL